MKVRSMNKANKWKFILSFALIIILAVALLCVGLKVNKLETTKSVGSSSFNLGSLNSNGSYVAQTAEDQETIVSNFIKLDGLKIDVPDNNGTSDDGVEYKLFYYDEDHQFISANSSYSNGDYSASADTTLATGQTNASAKYVRIQVRYIALNPVTNLISKVTLCNHLNITVNK